MTAQVLATPGGASIHTSGSVIIAQPGVGYQIADVAPDGTVGPALTPPDLVLAVNDPNLGDISITLPDGTVLVFQGMVTQFGQGGGFADADGGLVVASLEDAVAAAAGGGGGTGGGGDDAGGSSQAFNPANTDPLGNDFGSTDGGPGVDDGGAGGGDDDDDPGAGEDPNLILTTATTAAAANSAPNAVDDVGATDEDNAVPVPVITGLLSNDSDPDGDPLTITAVNGVPANVGNQFALGSGALLTVNADGSYNYNPNGQFETLSVGQTATDTFTYTISDGNGGVDTANVTITINGVNDPPVAQDDILAIAETEVEVSAVAPDFNLFADNGNGPDTDIDAADAFTVSAVGAPVLNGFAAAGVNVTNVPAFGAGPPFTATIEIDGGATTAILTVNADGTANLVAGVGDPFAALGGAQSGTIAFAYTIDDGNTGTDMATATITVNGVNDPPVAQDDTLAITETEVEVNAVATDFNLFADNGNGADTDAEGDAFTVTAVGPVTLNGFAAAGVNVTNVPAFGAGPPFMATIEIDGGATTAILTVNADGTSTLVAGAGDPFAALGAAQSGTIAFAYTIDDGNTGTDTATATITVNGANDAPVAQDDTLAITETEVEVSAVEPDFNLFADNSNGADVDVDGDVFTVSAVGAPVLNGFAAAGVNITNVPAFGAGPPFMATIEIDNGASTAILTVNADGTANLVAGVGDPFAALGGAQSGTIAFAYTIDDGNTGTDMATATITVNGVNDPPVAQDDALAITEAEVETSAVAPDFNLFADNGNGADTDAEGDAFMVSAVGPITLNGFAAAGVNVTNVPAFGAGPPFMATIEIDGGATTAVLTVNADGTANLVAGVGDPFAALGAAQSGTIAFAYTIDDGNTGTDMATATITVNGVNDPPVAQDDTLTITETEVETSAVAPDFNLFADNGSGVDSDPDGDAFMVSAVGNIVLNGFAALGVNVTNVPAFGAGPPFMATIEIDGGATTAVLTVNADGSANLVAGVGDPFAAMDDNESGTIGFTYTIDDGNGSTDTATATITVNGVNDPPVAQDDCFTTNEDLVLSAVNVVGNVITNPDPTGTDSDGDGDTLTVEGVATGTGVNGSGLSFGGLPAGFLVPSVVINLLPPAGAVYQAFITTSDGEATLTVAENGDVFLTRRTAGDDPFDSLDPGDTVTISLNYTLTDGTVTTTANATVKVEGVSLPPVVDLDADNSNSAGLDFAATFTEGLGPVSITDTDSDVTDPDDTTVVSMTMTLTNAQDGAAETIAANAGGTGLTVTPNGSNTVITVTGVGSFADFETVLETLTYNNSSEDPNGTTVREVQVVVNDGQSDSAPATAFVTVTPVNDPPAVDLDGDNSNSPGLDFDAGNYSHGDGPVSIVDVDPSVTDVDSQINTMTIVFNGAPPDGAMELLSVTLQGGVTSAAVANGIELTGPADPSVFQAILQTLSYENSDPSPTLGARTINITVTDDEGGASITSPAADATINVVPRIFFIDNDPNNHGTGNNDGSQTDPFQSIADFNTAAAGGGADAPQAGDIIYLRSGSGDYDEPDGINLMDGQVLIGQEEALNDALTDLGFTALAVFPTETAGTAPVIEASGAGNNGIDLGQNNTIRGLDIGDTMGVGIEDGGGTVGTLTIEGVTIGGAGGAFDVDQGGTLDVTFESISSTSVSDEGIDISGVGGTFTVTGLTNVDSIAATGIDLTSSATATFNFDGGIAVTTNATNGGGLTANNAGTVNIGGTANTIGAIGGHGLDIQNTTVDNGAAGGGVTFASVSSTNSTFKGINLDTVTGDVTINGGAISGATANSFDLNGGSDNVTYAGTINHNTPGVTGIEVTNHSGGTVTFSGTTKSISSTTANGVELTNNAGATINFTNGGLDIDTTSGTAFNATGGGTVNVSGTGNSATATTGTAVDIDGTMIGTGVTFQSVSSSGGSATGIILNNAGSGGFTVTGDGTNAQNASGGTIANKTGVDGQTGTGIGIFINNTSNVDLGQMQLNDFSNFAIRGTNVTNFTLSDSVINGVNGNSTGNDEGSVSFSNLLGTALIEGSNISGGLEDNINVVNTSGTLNRLTVQDSGSNQMVIGLNSTASGNDGIFVESQNAAVVNVTVTGTQFLGARGDLFQSNTLNNSTMDVVLTDNTFNNSHTNVAPGGGGVTLSGGGAGSNINVTYNISGTSLGSQVFDFVNGIPGTAITANFLAGNGTINGTIQNNQIGTAGNPGSGGSKGMTIGAQDQQTYTVLIDNNVVEEIAGRFGIDVIANNDSTMNATITNNVVQNLVSIDPLRGINLLVGGGGTGDTATFNADIQNNIVNLGAALLSEGFQFDQVFNSAGSGANFNLPGYVGPANPSDADIAAYLNGRGNSSTAANPYDVGADVDGVTGFAFLHAASAPASSDAAAAEQAALSAPSLAELAALSAAAVERWIESGITDEQLALLEGVTVSLADLDGLKLGANVDGAIFIDLDAAGHGWFIDQTPLDDSEFEVVQSDSSLVDTDGPAAGSIDLLTVLMHELGHSLGLPDIHPTQDPDDLLTATLNSGERRLPDQDNANDALTLSDVLDGAGGGGDAQAGGGGTAGDPNMAAPVTDDYDNDASVYA